MIRSALALTAGFLTAAVVDNAPVRAVRRWYLGVHLRLVVDEMQDVAEEIADTRINYTKLFNEADRMPPDELGTAIALRAQAYNRQLDAEALIVFYRQLKDKRDELQRRISTLN